MANGVRRVHSESTFFVPLTISAVEAPNACYPNFAKWPSFCPNHT